MVWILLTPATSLHRIQRMQGGAEMTLSAHATLTSTTTKNVWARPPIDVDFQVLMFTASGLIVRFLKVFEKSSYQSVKWVRYLTKASGSYQIRVSESNSSLHGGYLDWTDHCSRCSSEVCVRACISIPTSCFVRHLSGSVVHWSVTLPFHFLWLLVRWSVVRAHST